MMNQKYNVSVMDLWCLEPDKIGYPISIFIFSDIHRIYPLQTLTTYRCIVLNKSTKTLHKAARHGEFLITWFGSAVCFFVYILISLGGVHFVPFSNNCYFSIVRPNA